MTEPVRVKWHLCYCSAPHPKGTADRCGSLLFKAALAPGNRVEIRCRHCKATILWEGVTMVASYYQAAMVARVEGT